MNLERVQTQMSCIVALYICSASTLRNRYSTRPI